jgi:GT2 family glycosyltransferase
MSNDSKRSSGKNLNTGSGAIKDGNTKGNMLMVKTAIVILNWNGLEYLKRFFPGMILNSASKNISVYVADNGSTDGSIVWMEENYPATDLIKLEKNHGFAGGYNLALAQIDAQYYILVNSDVEVTPGWAEKLTGFMEKNPEAAACQPKIISWHDRSIFEYAGAAGGYLDRYGYPFCRGRILTNPEKDNGQYDSEKEVFWTSGACMILRSEAWKRCGGFDTDFFAHMEEIDLCWRFHLSGYRLYQIPEVKVFHIGGGSLSYDSSFKVYLNFRNNLYMLFKNLPPRVLFKTMLIRMMLDGIAALYFLLKGKPVGLVSVWRAHMDFYRNLKQLKIKRELIERPFPDNPGKYILNKSVVFEFYIKGNKTFDRLHTNF